MVCLCGGTLSMFTITWQEQQKWWCIMMLLFLTPLLKRQLNDFLCSSELQRPKTWVCSLMWSTLEMWRRQEMVPGCQPDGSVQPVVIRKTQKFRTPRFPSRRSLRDFWISPKVICATYTSLWYVRVFFFFNVGLQPDDAAVGWLKRHHYYTKTTLLP